MSDPSVSLYLGIFHSPFVFAFSEYFDYKSPPLIFGPHLAEDGTSSSRNDPI